MRGFIFLFLFLLIQWSRSFGPNPFLDITERENSLRKLDECFCELSGPVDVCCCDVETVDSLNADNIYPLISNIVKQTYFRFFKINLQRVCPFWTDNGHCVLKDCHVERCSEEEIPTFLKGEKSLSGHIVACSSSSEEELKLSSVNDDISSEQAQEFLQWERHDDAQENFCFLEDESSLDANHVDLVLNPERYTGYSGHSPQRIWSAIYNENCFRPSRASAAVPFEASRVQEMCLEKRAFFRLISGLHSSINIHLSAEYIKTGALTDQPTFGPNLNEFVRRFDFSTTKGQGPSWLKNLYFAYLVVLKAITKAEVLWPDQRFYTGNTAEDKLVKQNIQKLVKAANGCGHSLFDESQMFNTDTSHELKEEFRSHFLNISRIMDCVGCNKCRLWGTLQVQGIGTALKILFSNKTHLYLKRQEIVALFNVLGRFSSSIQSLQEFRAMQSVKQSPS